MKLESAEQRLSLLRRRWHEAQSKLAQLEQFRADYAAQLMTRLQAGIAADLQRDYQAFLAKLDSARQQQSAEVARCKHTWEGGFQEWSELKARHEAMLALRERHLRNEQIVERRQEQKLQDEFAARSGTNRPNPE